VSSDPRHDESFRSHGGGTEDTEAIDGASEPPGARVRAPLEPGASVGRYLVVELVGAGGMGEVYSAFDPQLDRKVALKILRAAAPDALEVARLLREARSLARLSHPNVVTVYDAGVTDADVHIAMEFVEGTTLAEWLRAPRSWREVLRVFASAGEGLAAAHASGLVHRDFKPDNVMIGRDDRIRVMDFGLARSATTREVADETRSVPESSQSTVELTAAGKLVGTPAYLAPEVYAGRHADARADQFSFCVALWIGLFGMRPFAGDVAFEIAAAAAHGKIRTPPTDSSVPTWVRRIVERGLAADPSARWQDMPTLLAALQRDPSRRRRWVIGLAGVGAVAIASLVARAAVEAARVEACDREAEIADVWNDDVARQIRGRFDASGLGFAEATFERVRDGLADYASSWSIAQREICLATPRGPVESEASRRCMDERKTSLAKTIGVLVGAERDDVIGALAAISRQPAIDDCRDDAYLASRAASSDEATPRAEEIERRRAELRTLLDFHRDAEAVTLARENVAAAEELGAPWLAARTRADLGEALMYGGKLVEAREVLETAYFDASSGGDDRVAAEAAARLLTTTGELLGKTEDGLLWGRLARAAIERTPGDSTRARAGLLAARARVQQIAGDLEAAVRDAESALELYEQAYDARHPDLFATVNTVGMVYLGMGDDVRAQAAFERSLQLAQEAFGESHPEVARILNNLAGVAYTRGDGKRARVLTEQSLAIKRQWFGPDSREVATALNALGNLEIREGDSAAAQVWLEQSVAILRKNHAGDHPALFEVMSNLADAHFDQQHMETAEQMYRECLAMSERLFGAGHAKHGAALVGMGVYFAYADRPVEAEAHLRRALANFETGLPTGHPETIDVLVELGKLLVETGRAQEAVEFLRRATEALDGKESPDPMIRGRARQWLARARWATERDAAGARALLALADADYLAVGDAIQSERDDMAAWRASVRELAP
jgi:tetratricopeptide (TPR) repeat protein